MRGEPKLPIPGWARAPERLVADFTKAAEAVPGATVRRMFGYPAAFLAGSLFAGIFEDSVIRRLPQEMRQALAGQGGRPFEPMPGRVMNEYVVLPKNVVRSARLLTSGSARRRPTR